MDMEFDPEKNKRNIAIRGIDFSIVANFDFDSALEIDQIVNKELRHFALGLLGSRLYALVYTLRGDTVRVISLRKANTREVLKYEQSS